MMPIFITCHAQKELTRRTRRKATHPLTSPAAVAAAPAAVNAIGRRKTQATSWDMLLANNALKWYKATNGVIDKTAAARKQH
jgi:hypothetical protein